MSHSACECSERQRRAPTLAQGNALGWHRKTNPSPESALQAVPQRLQASMFVWQVLETLPYTVYVWP